MLVKLFWCWVYSILPSPVHFVPFFLYTLGSALRCRDLLANVFTPRPVQCEPMIRGSTDTIIDIRVTNVDSKSYKNLPPEKAMERQEKEKKKKYCKPCQNQRRHFTPFVVSTDGIFGFETWAFLKRLAKLLAEEWKKPYPTGRGFINARMSIALVRVTNWCIRGSRIPASNMSTRSRWEGGAGLGLLKSDN